MRKARHFIKRSVLLSLVFLFLLVLVLFTRQPNAASTVH